LNFTKENKVTENSKKEGAKDEKKEKSDSSKDKKIEKPVEDSKDDK